jgi:hypothetical protein
MPHTERQLKSQIKIGAVLALFGLLCPFFWFSAFSGNAGFETWVYGVHSCIFIVLGLTIVGKGWYDLNCIRMRNRIKDSDAGI